MNQTQKPSTRAVVRRAALPVALAAALALVGSTPALAGPTHAATGLTVAATAKPTNTTKVVSPLKSKAYSISSYYGPRCMPTRDASDWHLGQDLGAKDGTPIMAVAGGVVRTAGAVSGMGQWIIVDHVIGGQKVSTVYGHMWNARKYVHAGQTVTAGQHIADVGANGIATGPHLHLEVWKGGYGKTSTDPLAYLRSKGIDLTKGATSILRHVVPSSCTYYSTTRLNLRAGASVGTPSLLVLPVNARLTAKPGSKAAGWLPVTYGSHRGWVDVDYVSPSKVGVASPKPAPKPAPKALPHKYVDVTALNLRSRPTTSSSVLALLHEGRAVQPLAAVSDGWQKVTVGGKTGYVASRYLRSTR